MLPKIFRLGTHPNVRRPRSTVVKGDLGTGRGCGIRAGRAEARPCPGQTRYAAVYQGLPAGRYTVWRAHTPVTAVTVTGGQVSSCHWPG